MITSSSAAGPAVATVTCTTGEGPYVHLIADIGAHRHVRYQLAACQVMRQFAPDKALALEIAPRSIRYAHPARHARDETATPADRPDVAVFLTDPAGDLSERTHAHLLRLIEGGVPVWRVIPAGENDAGVHPPAATGSSRGTVRTRPASTSSR